MGLAIRDSLLVGLLFTLAASLTTPVRDHLMIGQVNAFLILLATLDLVRPRTR